MSDEKPKPKSNSRRNLLLMAVVLGLTYGGYRLYLQRKPYEWSGTVEARTISVGSRTGGRVKEIKVREGDTVGAGQALIVLESRRAARATGASAGATDVVAGKPGEASKGRAPRGAR